MKINTIRLRLILGILGMALPWIVLILANIFDCIPGHIVPDSISATYYLAPCVTPFIIILGSAGILLISYQGYDKQDDIVCSLAGIFALFICLFPCSTDILAIVGTFQLPVNVSSAIHNISAVIFFALLSYNSFFLFTKSSGELTENKRKRNIIFRVCGVGMIGSFVLLIPVILFKIWGGTWLVETIALAFFGISWLTKCDIFPFLFCDTPYKD